MLNILEVYDFSMQSGVGRVASSVSDALRDRGHEVTELCADSNKADVVIEPLCGQPGPAAVYKLSRRISKIARERRIDVIHVHQRRLATAALIAQFGRRVPVVEHVHSVFHDKTWTSFRADRIISLTQGLADHLAAAYPHARESIVVVPNGVEVLDAVPAMSIGDPRLVSVGRVEAAKGVDELLAVMSELRRHIPNVTCEWVGGGTGALKTLIESGVHHGVTFTGPSDNVRVKIGRAHALISLSKREGVPLSMLDAMALGRPVFASQVGGVQEVVGGGGRTWSPATKPKDIAEMLIEPLQNRDLLAALGQTARDRQSRLYDLQAMSDGCEEVLRQVVAEA